MSVFHSIKHSPLQSLFSSKLVRKVYFDRALMSQWYRTLSFKQSITALLRQQGDVTVTVLWQGKCQSRLYERQALHSQERLGWIRDVCLSVNGQSVLYARTYAPISTVTGAERALCRIGARSLGDYLFSHSKMKKKSFSLLKVSENGLAIKWARQQIYHLNNKPLLLVEAFVRPLIV